MVFIHQLCLQSTLSTLLLREDSTSQAITGLKGPTCLSGQWDVNESEESPRQGKQWSTSPVSEAHSLFSFFPQSYWEIIDICDYRSWRHIAWWFDLHTLWNNYHDRFRHYPSSHCIYNKKKKKEKRKWKGKKILPMTRTHGIYTLNFSIYHTAVLAVVMMLHIVSLVLIYITSQLEICISWSPSSKCSPHIYSPTLLVTTSGIFFYEVLFFHL